jgi:hypothetical protein
MDGGRRSYLVATGAVAAVICYLAWRPRMLRWGATTQEAAEALPGDDRTPHPRVRSTRAITIQAPPEQVWPWIVQMGSSGRVLQPRPAGAAAHLRWPVRGGKAFGDADPPELQDLKVGDPVPYGAGVLARVEEIEPCKHLVPARPSCCGPLPGDGTH